MNQERWCSKWIVFEGLEVGGCPVQCVKFTRKLIAKDDAYG